MVINVADYMPKTEESIFIRKKPADTKAAAYRYAVLERILEEWFTEINSDKANTREIPYELKEMYEQACKTMLKIRMYEQDILLGKKDK